MKKLCLMLTVLAAVSLSARNRVHFEAYEKDEGGYCVEGEVHWKDGGGDLNGKFHADLQADGLPVNGKYLFGLLTPVAYIRLKGALSNEKLQGELSALDKKFQHVLDARQRTLVVSKNGKEVAVVAAHSNDMSTFAMCKDKHVRNPYGFACVDLSTLALEERALIESLLSQFDTDSRDVVESSEALFGTDKK